MVPECIVVGELLTMYGSPPTHHFLLDPSNVALTYSFLSIYIALWSPILLPLEKKKRVKS